MGLGLDAYESMMITMMISVRILQHGVGGRSTIRNDFY